MRAKHLKGVAFLAIVGVIGMVSTQFAAAEDERWEGRKLEGSWVVQVALHDCTSGTPIGLPFQSLLTFAKGGTMTETTANAMFFPAERGPGHGVWSRKGAYTYNALTEAFVTLNGALQKTQTIAQTIEVDTEDSMHTTEATVKFYKPDGTLLATGCAAATGKRIESEP